MKAIVLLLGLIAQVAQANSIPNEVNGVVSHLVGVMDTTAQAASNPKAPSVRMTTCKIDLRGGDDSVYLYQEQALITKLSQPYRQRILEIQPHGDAVRSKSYKLINGNNWINLCNKLDSERVLQRTDLGESVCSVFLRPIKDGYRGETPPQGCPTNARGAVKITNTVILHSEGMDTYDRGYDSDGRQVWGAQGESYQYRWVK
ncbi:MAG: Chromophore lyase CpcT/CpeT [Chroococcopsis gigantea SAG 12.99]|jgi:hypothetical protein|nr:chromophore lyase CpcT/CpeT [Chlorogloea purpurea SAG 13.99]MDV2998499.1 Chromophore lyase CpcT/CpeT [Chroococcopsis gigantea SAG 12.99]